ncbi:MAG: tetratricopeptide repeat protein [Myxococcaceae bacterium]
MRSWLKRSLLGAGALLAASTLALAGCDKGGAPAHLEKARAALYNKHPQEALSEYKMALDALDKDESKEAPLYRARALRGAADVYYLELHDFPRAVEVYRELIKLCPEAPETLDGRLNLADLLERQFHDLRGSIAELTAALARNPPQSAELAYRVAKLYFELGDYQQCELEAANLAKHYETSTYVDDALLLRGQALAMMDDRKADAMKSFEELTQRFPDSELRPHALFEEGKLLADTGEPEKAIEVWVEALKKHPDPSVVQAVIARVRKQLRRSEPTAVGDAAKAFDRDVPGANVGPFLSKPKTSLEAVGGSSEEQAREARMGSEGPSGNAPPPSRE